MITALTPEQHMAAKMAAADEYAALMNEHYSRLETYDPRLTEYLEGLKDTVRHNLYEILAGVRFFRFFGRHTMEWRKVKAFLLLFESLPLPGKTGRAFAVASPVQVFQFANIYGWYDGERRVTRDVLLYVPRKFGKTTQCQAIALNDLLFGPYDAESYLSANSFDQAQICYRGLNRIVKILDGGRGRFRATRDTIELRMPGRESAIRCLSNSPDKLDGLKASTSINDELSQADSFDQKNVVVTSMATQDNPLTVDITTASGKTEAPFTSELELYKAILRGEVDNDSVFAHIFQPDEGDDDGDENTWRKVQPHIGVTVNLDFYREQWKRAQRSYDELTAFRTKLLNRYVFGTRATWIKADAVTRLMKPVDFSGCQDLYGVAAIDLSVRGDFSAVTYIVYNPDRQHFTSRTDYYLPEGSIEDHVNAELYRAWARDGRLTLLPGNTISYERIAGDIIRHGDDFLLCKIGYDPYRDAELLNILKASGAGGALQSIGQTRSHFTAACGQMEILIDRGAITFDDNPITAWCFGNAVMDEDNNGNRKPMKRTASGKIDGVITNLMAVKLWAELK